jgi:hypothetical protein
LLERGRPERCALVGERIARAVLGRGGSVLSHGGRAVTILPQAGVETLRNVRRSPVACPQVPQAAGRNDPPFASATYGSRAPGALDRLPPKEALPLVLLMAWQPKLRAGGVLPRHTTDRSHYETGGRVRASCRGRLRLCGPVQGIPPLGPRASIRGLPTALVVVRGSPRPAG